MLSERFRIGNQTSYSASPWTAPYRFALEHGFAAFEWFADRRAGRGWGFADLGPEKRRELREQGASVGMRFTVHAPCEANPLDPRGAAQLREGIDFARDIGAALVNVHLFLERGAAAFARAIARVAPYATAAGVRLALENLPESGPADCNAVFRALRDLAAPAGPLGLCLDIGHANLCPATRNDYVRFLDRLDPEIPILHAHFHENWGDRDRHLLLFSGPSGSDSTGIRLVLERLVARGFDGSVILEQWLHPPTLLCVARRRLLELLREIEASPSGVGTHRSLHP